MQALPLLLVVAFRPAAAEARGELLARLAAEPLAVAIHPTPLATTAVADLVAVGTGAAPEPAFAEACRRATGGNPFLLSELIRSLVTEGVAPVGSEAPRVGTIGPESVSRSVLLRLANLRAEAGRVARAVGILGDDAELRHAAALAGLTEDAVGAAADDLARVGVFEAARPLRFAHPVVRAAIVSALGAGERSQAHRRAAEVLATADAPVERIAVHLLATEPPAGRKGLRTLREAARRAGSRGTLEAVITYLDRALGEDIATTERFDLLLELGRAEAHLRRPEAPAHLREAHDLAATPRQRAEAARSLVWAGAPEGSAAAVVLLDDAIEGLGDGDRELRERLRAERLAVMVGAPGHTREEAAGLDALRPPAAGEAVIGATESITLVALARWRTMRGASAAEVGALAERAMADGHLLEEISANFLWFINGVVSLLQTDRLSQADGVLDAAVRSARRRGAGPIFSLATNFRSAVAYQRGDVARAEAEARASIDASALDDWHQAPAFAALIGALLERGQLQEAADALAEAKVADPIPDSRPYTPLLLARGRLRVEQGSVNEGLSDLLEAERRLGRSGGGHAVGLDGKVRTALALLSLGEREQALSRARDAVARARRWNTPRAIGSTLRALGLVEGGPEGLAALHEAVATLEHSPARLELARALVDLGGGMRRANRRADAREPLRRSLELAQRCGADALAESARRELAVTGVRVPRPARGGLDSLTPSERRIADMAADGRSNPEIAQALFVTVKTVEMHLGNGYRKLAIGSRRELADVLAKQGDGAGSSAARSGGEV